MSGIDLVCQCGKLENNMKTSYGFLPIEITPDQYIFGSDQIKGEVLVPDGQWFGYLPDIEVQRQFGLETMNCTVYGTLNCIEILFKRVYNVEVNHSERFVGIHSGTTPSGNNPHEVGETIRKKAGCVEDMLLPFSESIDTWEKYYGPNPLPKQLNNLGKEWIKAWDFKHDWVRTPGQTLSPELLMEALTYSPLGVSVDAWNQNGEIYFKEKGGVDNHWTTLYGYLEGQYWLIFDSYDSTHKKLAWDYDFQFVKRYTLTKKQPTTNGSIWGAILNFIRSYRNL